MLKENRARCERVALNRNLLNKLVVDYVSREFTEYANYSPTSDVKSHFNASELLRATQSRSENSANDCNLEPDHPEDQTHAMYGGGFISKPHRSNANGSFQI